MCYEYNLHFDGKKYYILGIVKCRKAIWSPLLYKLGGIFFSIQFCWPNFISVAFVDHLSTGFPPFCWVTSSMFNWEEGLPLSDSCININININIIKNNLNNIIYWCNTNKMARNSDECKIMRLSRRINAVRPALLLTLYLASFRVLFKIFRCLDLRITISSNLKWRIM